MALAEIDAQLRRAKQAPIDQIGSMTRMPQPLRRLGWWLAGRTGRWHATNFTSS
jgi:hypothetical protein